MITSSEKEDIFLIKQILIIENQALIGADEDKFSCNFNAQCLVNA
jgi:hypothetical protein